MKKKHNNFIAAYCYLNNLCLFSTALINVHVVFLLFFFHWAIKSSHDSCLLIVIGCFVKFRCVLFLFLFNSFVLRSSPHQYLTIYVGIICLSSYLGHLFGYSCGNKITEYIYTVARISMIQIYKKKSKIIYIYIVFIARIGCSRVV